MEQKSHNELQFRRSVMYAFGVMAAVGNSISLIGGFFTSNVVGSQHTTQIISSSTIILLGLTVLVLTRLGLVKWAGILFCGVGTTVISISLFSTGVDSFVPVLYIVVVVVAGAIISPWGAIFFGTSCFLLYVSLNVWLISRLPPPVPAEIGAKVAILALVIVATTGLLYAFSNSLGQVVAATRSQAEELGRLNRELQHQHVMEAHTAQQINELTRLLGQLLQEQTSTSENQSTLVSQVAVATRELDSVARQIAGNAGSVATTAERAQKSVEVGQNTAQQGMQAIAMMRERVQDINTNMHTLNQQLQNISEVTTIIGEIADETNLLALNATIEAAGAREYGRRFAAVAEEVQRLARRASAAVEQIQDMVIQINQASTKALAATEQGLREAHIGDDLISRLNFANQDIIELISQTSMLASNIAMATQQQHNASTQIVDVMQQIIATTNTLSEASQNVSDIVDTLEESSKRLSSEAGSETQPAKAASYR